MSYSKLLMQMAQNYVIAANMAVQNNEPYNAVMFYENLNALLPDGTSNIEQDDELDCGDNAENSELLATSYRVDLSTIRPEQINRYSNEPYLSNSLSQDRIQWDYLKKLSSAVLEALGKFASDHREHL